MPVTRGIGDLKRQPEGHASCSDLPCKLPNLRVPRAEAQSIANPDCCQEASIIAADFLSTERLDSGKQEAECPPRAVKAPWVKASWRSGLRLEFLDGDCCDSWQ